MAGTAVLKMNKGPVNSLSLELLVALRDAIQGELFLRVHDWWAGGERDGVNE